MPRTLYKVTLEIRVIGHMEKTHLNQEIILNEFRNTLEDLLNTKDDRFSEVVLTKQSIEDLYSID